MSTRREDPSRAAIPTRVGPPAAAPRLHARPSVASRGGPGPAPAPPARAAVAVALVAAMLAPVPARADVPPPGAREFSIARLKYGGGGDWYEDRTSLVNLLRAVRDRT